MAKASPLKDLTLSKRLRRLRMGLATLLGRPQGFFIPYRYARSAEAAVGGYPEIERLFKAREATFAEYLGRTGDYADDLRAIAEDAQPPEPRWGQGWFPRLDAAMAYAFVRSFDPKRLIEIGSGHSTRFMARARRDGGLSTELTAIDPAPRADLDRLSLTLHRAPLQQAPLDLFGTLADGDIVVVDSSHILMPGSDLDVFLGRILPQLPKGILLHFHDIFLPDPYPTNWAWRGYNEQAALLPLLHSSEWDVLFASNYAVTRMARQVQSSVIAELPRWDGVYESSLWLRKIDPCASSRGSERI